MHLLRSNIYNVGQAYTNVTGFQPAGSTFIDHKNSVGVKLSTSEIGGQASRALRAFRARAAKFEQ